MTPAPICAATHRITAAVDALDQLLSAPTAPTKNQQSALNVLQSWLRVDMLGLCDDQTACTALSNLVGTSIDSTIEHFGAFIGPLLVWSARQPWSQDVHEARAFSALCNLHFVRQSRAQPYDTCIAALESILQWLPRIPNAMQSYLAAHAMQDINTKMLWDERRISAPAYREDEKIIATLLAHLANQYPNYFCATTMLDLWSKAMDDYATASLSLEAQYDWLMWTLTVSDMPAPFKLHIAKSVVPEVWIETAIRDQLQSILPAEENQRFPLMPWAVKRSPIWSRAVPTELPEETNHAILRMYCPLAEGMLTCITTPQDWRERKVIGALMEQLSNPAAVVPMLELPDDLA